MIAAAQFPEVENLVNELYTLFQGPRLFDVEEVGIFNSVPPTGSERTKSHAIQVTPRHVGLASWALNPLYVSCKSRLASDREDIAAATVMLLVSPDFLTAWNIRKASFKPQALDTELHFSALVITRSPKSAETWAHRDWIIRTVGLDHIRHRDEILLTWMAASRAFCNYYAGVHRIRIIPAFNNATLLSELGRSRTWLRTHIGDSSGWTYHRAILKVLFERQILVKRDEESWFSEMVLHYASTHQNIASHSRWFSTVNIMLVQSSTTV